MHIRPHSRIITGFLTALVISIGPTTTVAQLDGHGPDVWQVTGVEPHDILNIRMGPGTDYPVIGAFAHDAAGLQQITCVPFMTIDQSVALSAADRASLPPRWCLMSDAVQRRQGWVAARFLMEDGGQGQDIQASATDPVAAGVALVEALYAQHERYISGKASNPFQGPDAERYFFRADLVELSRTVRIAGADPLYNAQDTDISNLRIAPDPDNPMLRGMVTVLASYRNFGQPFVVEFNLRADPDREGAPLRIMRISHDGWELP